MITQKELVVGITYTDIGEKTRTILCIGLNKVMYREESGKESIADIDVILDVLTLFEPKKKLKAA